MKSRSIQMILVFVSGALFGAGLALSGMTNPARVLGFLDFFGAWDPTLMFVMIGALAVFGGGLLWLKKTGTCGFENQLPDTSSDPISPGLIVGAALFGLGWGLGGLCPGPALANLGRVPISEVLIFVPAMLAGIVIAQRTGRTA